MVAARERRWNDRRALRVDEVQNHNVSSQDDVRRCALALPGVTEEEHGYKVCGKLFAHDWPERVDPKKPKVPNPDVLVVRVAGEGDKQALLASDPRKFFTTDHYNGYPSVLVRLAEVDEQELAELIIDSWRARAPANLVRDYDLSAGPREPC